MERLSEVRSQDEAAFRARFASQREKLAYFIANVEAPYAADRILDEFEKLDLPEARRNSSQGGEWASFRTCAGASESGEGPIRSGRPAAGKSSPG